ncbi:MAG: hypothetical protein J6J59_03200, partial [Peptococcaceae bacterium]|nr:hypothetical protein [Peptococcaceae bacterium]
MKSKKLFAILTLVCFMFTLMPVAAFAAVDEIVDDQIYVADEAVTAENADVELTIGDQSEDV